MKYLSPDQTARFDQDGFLVIDGFLDPVEVARVEAGIARVASGVGDIVRDQGHFNLEKVGDASFDQRAAPKRPGMLRKIQGAVFAVDEVREVLCAGQMVDCIADLIGPAVHYHSSKVMFKPPGGSAKPWHQDAAYWQHLGAEQITAWIAIDDADEQNGCVWAIPGSHRHGLVPHAEHELQVDPQRLDLAGARPVPVRAGGLLIFDALVLHMSHRNQSNRTRWAIIADYDRRPSPAQDCGDQRVPGMDADGVWRLNVGAVAR